MKVKPKAEVIMNVAQSLYPLVIENSYGDKYNGIKFVSVENGIAKMTDNHFLLVWNVNVPNGFYRLENSKLTPFTDVTGLSFPHVDRVLPKNTLQWLCGIELMEDIMNRKLDQRVGLEITVNDYRVCEFKPNGDKVRITILNQNLNNADHYQSSFNMKYLNPMIYMFKHGITDMCLEYTSTNYPIFFHDEDKTFKYILMPMCF